MIKVAELKQEYIEYFKDSPIQKYAAQYIGRDEDTIIRWKKQDKVFADCVQRAMADWVRKRVLQTKSEYLLEKLVAEVFNPKPEVQVQTQYNFSIHDERGRQLSQRYTDFMLEATKEEITTDSLVGLRNAKDYTNVTD